ncbi:TPA: Abi family protein [Streptococcus suis]|nr:Abi family protein [Streptococcus suis]
MSKPFKTIDEQLEILRGRDLTIDNEMVARNALLSYGYYEIVNGYKTFLLKQDCEEEQFIENETFSHLLSLYELDKEIRNGVMEATLEVEIALRTAIAYTISEKFGSDESLYLRRSNYMRGKKREGSNRYPLHQLFDKLDKILQEDLEPYKHYREVHGNIPPWILLKGTTFGNLVNFYKLLKPSEKTKVISICYGLEESFITESIKNMFSQTLNLIHSYRNRAAHSGRIFSYKSDKSIVYNEVFHKQMDISLEEYNDGKGQTGLSTLLTALYLFKNKRIHFLLEFAIYYNTKQHCEKYPNDLTLLCHETEIDRHSFETNFKRFS